MAFSTNLLFSLSLSLPPHLPPPLLSLGAATHNSYYLLCNVAGWNGLRGEPEAGWTKGGLLESSGKKQFR